MRAKNCKNIPSKNLRDYSPQDFPGNASSESLRTGTLSRTHISPKFLVGCPWSILIFFSLQERNVKAHKNARDTFVNYFPKCTLERRKFLVGKKPRSNSMKQVFSQTFCAKNPRHTSTQDHRFRLNMVFFSLAGNVVLLYALSLSPLKSSVSLEIYHFRFLCR